MQNAPATGRPAPGQPAPGQPAPGQPAPGQPAYGRMDPGFANLMMPYNLDALFEMQRPFLSTMAEFNAKLIDSVTTFNREWVEFINTRLNEDLAVTRQLADCKSVHDAHAVCNNFLQTAAKHYQAEFDQMSKIGKTIADDTIHSVQDRLEDIARHPKAA